MTRVAGGPVGRSAGPKFAEWVQLRDRRTGATFVIVNHHLLYNIESKGHPDKRVGKKYLALAQKQMQRRAAARRPVHRPRPARRGHQGRQLGLPQVRPHQAPGQPVRAGRPPRPLHQLAGPRLPEAGHPVQRHPADRLRQRHHRPPHPRPADHPRHAQEAVPRIRPPPTRRRPHQHRLLDQRQPDQGRPERRPQAHGPGRGASARSGT